MKTLAVVLPRTTATTTLDFIPRWRFQSGCHSSCVALIMSMRLGKRCARQFTCKLYLLCALNFYLRRKGASSSFFGIFSDDAADGAHIVRPQ